MVSCRLVTEMFDEIRTFIIKVKDVLDTVKIRQELPIFPSLRSSFSWSKVS